MDQVCIADSQVASNATASVFRSRILPVLFGRLFRFLARTHFRRFGSCRSSFAVCLPVRTVHVDRCRYLTRRGWRFLQLGEWVAIGFDFPYCVLVLLVDWFSMGIGHTISRIGTE
jgi:hypothetical protein